VGGEEPHPTNYRGCRYAKVRIQSCRQRPRLQREGCSLPSTPPQGYLHGSATQQYKQEQQPQPPSVASAAALRHNQQVPSQFVCEHVQSSHNDISADHDELNADESEDNRIMAITKTVLKVMKQNSR
jgi:hypothetical protein